MKNIQTILCATLLALAPMAMAEEFSSTPKPETLAQAIQYEKFKLAAAEAQARKDAAEAARSTQSTKTKTARSTTTVRKTGQADSTPKK